MGERLALPWNSHSASGEQLLFEQTTDPMDVLSQLLATTETRGAVHVSAEFSGPWAFYVVPGAGEADVVLVTEGVAVVEVEGVATTLTPGGSVVLPRSVPYVVRSARAAARDAVPLVRVLGPCPAEQYRRVRFDASAGPLASARPDTSAPSDTDDPSDVVLLGTIQIEDAAANPIVEALPPVLLLSPDAAPWVGQTLALAAREAEAGCPGAEAVAARLSEVLLVYAIRTYVDELPVRCPDQARGSRGEWLHALADPQLGRALIAVQKAPERPWTVEALAEEAFMSRTTFATRFAEVVGTPPLRYVALWRVFAAARALRRGATVFEAADAVGYASQSSFSKAFKRETGIAPSDYQSYAERVEVGVTASSGDGHTHAVLAA